MPHTMKTHIQHTLKYIIRKFADKTRNSNINKDNIRKICSGKLRKRWVIRNLFQCEVHM